MGRSRIQNRSSILSHLFANIIFSMILVELANVGCGFVDGVIISRFLGTTAIAAQGIAYPYFSFLGIISGMLATGMQSLCTTYIGEGRKKELNSVFSLTCLVAGVFSILITLFLLLMSKQISVSLTGANAGAALLRDVQSYLRGVAVGTPALIFVAILAPIVQMDGSKMLVRTSVIVLCIADVIGDLLVAALGGGMFGMGLATSISNYFGVAILLLHFFTKNCTAHFTLSGLNPGQLGQILKIGLPKATKRLANTLRPLILNSLVLKYGAAAAMSAMSVRNNLNNLMDVFGSGLVSATLLMISILWGEKKPHRHPADHAAGALLHGLRRRRSVSDPDCSRTADRRVLCGRRISGIRNGCDGDPLYGAQSSAEYACGNLYKLPAGHKPDERCTYPELLQPTCLCRGLCARHGSFLGDQRHLGCLPGQLSAADSDHCHALPHQGKNAAALSENHLFSAERLRRAG